MRYGIIISIVLFGIFLIWRIVAARGVYEGSVFVVYAEDIVSVYQTYQRMKYDPQITQFNTKYVKIEYTPDNLEMFLNKIEYVICVTLDYYDKIKEKEKAFQVKDWEYIQELYEQVEEIENKVRYEKWQNGFKVTKI